MNLSKIIPIQGIEDNFLINGRGEITAGFYMENPEIFSLEASEAEINYQGFVNIIKMLNPGVIIHKQDFFYEYKYDELGKGKTFTEKADFEMYYNKPVLGNYTCFYLTFCAENKFKRGAMKTSLVKAKDYLFKNSLKIHKKRYAEVEKQILTVENGIKSLKGFKIKRMNNTQLGCALFDFLSMNYENPSSEYKEKKIPPYSIKDDKLYIGDNIIKVISLLNEGSVISSWEKQSVAKKDIFKTQTEFEGDIRLPTSYVYPIGIGLPINHILNTTIEILDNENTEEELKKELVQTKFLASIGNTKAKEKVEETNKFIENINKHDYKTCKMTCNVIINEKDFKNKELEHKTAVINNAFNKLKGAQPWIENYDTANLFLASCPGNVRDNYRDRLTTVESATCYLSKESHYLTSRSDKGYLYCDRFGKPVYLNLLNSKYIANKNGVCFGPSGTGKSFWFNGFIDQSLRMGGHFIILDVGASYKMNCELNEGYYYDAADVRNLKFNVFANCTKDPNGKYKYKKFGGEEEGEDKTSEIYSIIRQIWKKGQKVGDEEAVIMQKMIEEYYEYVNENGIWPDFKGFIEYSKKFEKELEQNEKKYFDFDGFRLIAKPFVNGIYKDILNAKENVDFTNERYVVFDVKGLDNNPQIADLLSVLIVQIVVDKIEKLPKDIPKIFLIDEALDFLKGEIGDFIGAMYRKIRKSGGSVLLATQDVSFIDEADPLVAKSIMKNSDIRILLGIEKKESIMKEVKEKLDLTEGDLTKLRTLKKEKYYREFFIKLGNYSQIYRNQVSLTSALAYTTDPDELSVIDVLKNKYKHLGMALNEFVEINKILGNNNIGDDEKYKTIKERYSNNNNGKLEKEIEKLVENKLD